MHFLKNIIMVTQFVWFSFGTGETEVWRSSLKSFSVNHALLSSNSWGFQKSKQTGGEHAKCIPI